VVTGRYTGMTAGKHVWLIDDNDRYGYLFLHLSAFADGVGRSTHVAAGDTLGYVGKTGNATHTPGHLHFGVARLNRPGTLADGKVKLNPRPFLHASDTPGIRRTLEALRTQLALRTHAMGSHPRDGVGSVASDWMTGSLRAGDTTRVTLRVSATTGSSDT